MISNDEKTDEYGFFIESAIENKVQIVSKQFLEKCKDSKKMVDETPFKLVDNPSIKTLNKSETSEEDGKKKQTNNQKREKKTNQRRRNNIKFNFFFFFVFWFLMHQKHYF